MAKFDTAGNIISQAALELGLGKIPNNDPFSSQDPVHQQLCGWLSSAGRLMATKRMWEHLVVNATITVQAGDSGDYDLPPDFVNMVERTGWDLGRRLPLMGPLSPGQWEFLKVWFNGAVLAIGYRIDADLIRLFPQPPAAGSQVSMEYRSSSWVTPAALVTGSFKTLGPTGASAVALAGDVCLLDSLLLTRAVKLEFKKEKGFDTSTALADFEAAWEMAVGAATEPPTLSLNGPKPGGSLPLISNINLPVTGFGGMNS